jgi:RNA methyltransferase, TrmH family
MHRPAPSASERRLLQRLKRRRAREETGLFLAEGIRVVEELVAAGIVPRLAVISSALEDTGRGRVLAGALASIAPLREVTDAELARLADTEAPQGVIVAAPVPTTELTSLRVPEHATVLVLDAVQDPGNFGTLVRTALAFGVLAVVALPGTVDPWNPKSVRAAAGATFRVPIAGIEWSAALAWLHSNGFSVYVATTDGTPLPQLAPAAHSALVVGNEGAGVGEPALRAADARVTIPMSGPAESLNVAIAAGILLYAFSQRG